jgi:regulator of sirC expression with transglutaminase-like and TPR domain
MNLDAVLTELSRDPAADHDVAAIALHLAKEEYPHLDVAAYLDQLRDLARDAKSHLGGGDLVEQTKGLCRYLFHQVGFRGNAKEYYDPRNSYLSDVMDRLTGIPITLSLVTIAVGRRAGLPLAGVGLPGHFIVQCQAAKPTLFIDPFHGGRHVTLDQCQAMVARVTGINLPIAAVDLWPVPPGPFVQRMLNNLRGIYLKADDPRRAARVLARLHQLNPSDAQVRRDLGVCLYRTQRFGPAIDHLASYLGAAPEAEDAAAINSMLQRARGQVGRWN